MEEINADRYEKMMEEIGDALVGISKQLININATLIELKVIVEKKSKGRIMPLIDQRNIA